MDDPNQIAVPPSFVALFTSPSGHRLTQPMQVVRERYELCEDLAQMLSEQASAAAFKSGAPESELLAGVARGLSGSEAGLAQPEITWVVTRLAEVLGWPAPVAD